MELSTRLRSLGHWRYLTPAQASLPLGTLFGRLACWSAIVVTSFSAGQVRGEEALPETIDRWIEAAIDGPLAPSASDSEFLRRVYLDLAGTIPTPEVAREFLDSDAPDGDVDGDVDGDGDGDVDGDGDIDGDIDGDKRARLVDRILDSPSFARRMQIFFDVMLLERRADKHVPGDQWRQYLATSFTGDKPYNQLVHEILSADGAGDQLRPAAKFFLDRDGDSSLLTRDVARLFFGKDLQCAQCHDHPLIDDYEQADYYSINSFLHRSFIYEFKGVDYNAKSGTVVFPPGTTEQVVMVAVRGDKRDEPNETVFVNLTGAKGAVIADAQGMGTILDDDGEDIPAEDNADAPAAVEPKEQSSEAPAGDDGLPRITINNWKLKERNGGTDGLPLTLTLSRPSTEEVSVDYATANGTADDGRDKPATVGEKADGEVTFSSVFDPDEEHQGNPQLPDGAGIEEPSFEEGEAYEVSPESDERPVPKFSRRRALAELATEGDSDAFNRNIANRLWAMMMGRGLVHPVDLHHEGNPPSHPELLDALADRFVATEYDIKGFLREIALSRTYQRSSVPPEELKDRGESNGQYDVALLKPLTPEQLAFSVREATGASATVRRDAEAELAGQPAGGDEAETDSRRSYLVEQKIYDAMQEDIAEFVRVFGQSGVQDFQATVQQALYLTNGDLIRRLLKPEGESLTRRLLQLDDPQRLADEMYISILTRRPTSEETERVVQYLGTRDPQREAAIQEMVWALLTSNEFRFNH